MLRKKGDWPTSPSVWASLYRAIFSQTTLRLPGEEGRAAAPRIRDRGALSLFNSEREASVERGNLPLSVAGDQCIRRHDLPNPSDTHRSRSQDLTACVELRDRHAESGRSASQANVRQANRLLSSPGRSRSRRGLRFGLIGAVLLARGLVAIAAMAVPVASAGVVLAIAGMALAVLPAAALAKVVAAAAGADLAAAAFVDIVVDRPRRRSSSAGYGMTRRR